MRFSSKRGAALAIVIVVSAALLILAAALVSVAQFNLSYAQNSLESRQAYLDAKSAIEYGKAYVTKNPTTGDFSVLYSTDLTDNPSGFKIGTTGNVVATYDSGSKLLSAAGKYKSSQRFRKLGYQFSTKSGGGSISNFVTCGSYGTVSDVPDYGSPRFWNQKANSSYPVLFNRKVQVDSGSSSLTAPAVYFVGKVWYSSNPPSSYDENNSWNFYGVDGANMKLYTPFLYITDNFYSSFSNTTDDDCRLLVYGEDTGKSCLAYFKNATKVYANGTLQLTIPQGFYKIAPGTNLFRMNKSNFNTYLTQATAEEETFQDQIDYGNSIKDATKIYSGDAWSSPARYGVDWAENGALKNGLCSMDNGNGDYNWMYKSTGGDIQVYLYISDCLGWGESSKIWYQNKAQYSAKKIDFQYVNSGSPFVIPNGKDVIFQTDTISINTQIDDQDSSASRPHIKQGDKNALFHLKGLSGGDVTVNIINNLTVDHADGSNFTIETGTYSVASGSNFFNPDTWKNKTGSGGSTGGSGGATTTGGTYTNG